MSAWSRIRLFWVLLVEFHLTQKFVGKLDKDNGVGFSPAAGGSGAGSGKEAFASATATGGLAARSPFDSAERSSPHRAGTADGAARSSAKVPACLCPTTRSGRVRKNRSRLTRSSGTTGRDSNGGGAGIDWDFAVFTMGLVLDVAGRGSRW